MVSNGSTYICFGDVTVSFIQLSHISLLSRNDSRLVASLYSMCHGRQSMPAMLKVKGKRALKPLRSCSMAQTTFSNAMKEIQMVGPHGCEKSNSSWFVAMLAFFKNTLVVHPFQPPARPYSYG